MLSRDELDEIRRAIESLSEPELPVEDILAGGIVLAERHAELLQHPLTVQDVTFALSIPCWYPLKPKPSPQNQVFLRSIRAPLFAEARANPDQLVEIVSDDVLALGRDQLFDLLQHGSMASVIRLPGHHDTDSSDTW